MARTAGKSAVEGRQEFAAACYKAGDGFDFVATKHLVIEKQSCWGKNSCYIFSKNDVVQSRVCRVLPLGSLLTCPFSWCFSFFFFICIPERAFGRGLVESS